MTEKQRKSAIKHLQKQRWKVCPENQNFGSPYHNFMFQNLKLEEALFINKIYQGKIKENERFSETLDY